MSRFIFAAPKVLLLSLFCAFYIVGCTNEMTAPINAEKGSRSQPISKIQTAAVAQSDKITTSTTPIEENTVNSSPQNPTLHILPPYPTYPGSNVYNVPFIIAINQWVDPVVDVERTVEVLNSNYQVVSTLESRYVGTYGSGQFSVQTPALSSGIYRLIFTTVAGVSDSEIIIVP